MAEDRANSAILDSRVRYWCDRLDLDADLRYAALANGRPVSFVEPRRGHIVLLHKIRPEELA